MARIHIGVTLLALAVLGAAYQDKDKDKKGEEPTKLKGQLPPYFKKVGLSDEQVQKVYKIRNDYKVKMDDLKKKMDQLKADEKDAMEKVLTSTQLKRLKELRSGEKASGKADK
jgi:hypothetical protein